MQGTRSKHLKQFLVKGVKNTVITFSGTVSKVGSANDKVIWRILSGIKGITNMFDSSEMQFFSAGYYGRGDQNRQTNFENEVNNLVYYSIEMVQWKLLRNLSENLYNHGVLCQDHSKNIIRQNFVSLGKPNPLHHLKRKILFYE